MGDDIADGGLVDVSGLALNDLRDLTNLRDENNESCLDRALLRILASSEDDGHHGFQSII
jgi:hypothetical protein